MHIFHSYYFLFMFDRPIVINYFHFLINNAIVSLIIIIITITILISWFYDECQNYSTKAIFIQNMYIKKKRLSKKYYFIVFYFTVIMTMRIATVQIVIIQLGHNATMQLNTCIVKICCNKFLWNNILLSNRIETSMGTIYYLFLLESVICHRI